MRKSDKKVVISYPAEYQGTKRIVNIMKIIGQLKPENSENGLNAQVQPSGAMLQFEGIISEGDLYDLLQNITGEYRETDLNRLAEIMESEYDREVEINVVEKEPWWKIALDKLRASAKSVEGPIIEANCSIDDEQLADEGGFTANEPIFFVKVNGWYTLTNLNINTAQDMVNLIHVVTSEKSGVLRRIVKSPEFKGQLIDTVEDFLQESGVKSIPSSEKEKEEAGETDDENTAIIYGADYDRLADSLASTISNWIFSSDQSDD